MVCKVLSFISVRDNNLVRIWLDECFIPASLNNGCFKVFITSFSNETLEILFFLLTFRPAYFIKTSSFSYPSLLCLMSFHPLAIFSLFPSPLTFPKSERSLPSVSTYLNCWVVKLNGVIALATGLFEIIAGTLAPPLLASSWIVTTSFRSFELLAISDVIFSVILRFWLILVYSWSSLSLFDFASWLWISSLDP